MEGGSLDTKLWHVSVADRATLKLRLRWLSDVAEGMVYLHNIDSVHRDLKSPNVLLANERAKIADFGLSKMFTQRRRRQRRGMSTKTSSESTEDNDSDSKARWTRTMDSFVGTPEWMAPEVMSTTGRAVRYGPAVDVYSFGVMMCESVTFEKPWRGVHDRTSVFASVQSGKRPHIDAAVAASAPKAFLELMRRCWSQDPKARPGARAVLGELENISRAL